MPIVEPEILSDGSHDLDTAAAAAEKVIAAVYKARPRPCFSPGRPQAAHRRPPTVVRLLSQPFLAKSDAVLRAQALPLNVDCFVPPQGLPVTSLCAPSNSDEAAWMGCFVSLLEV